MTAGRHSTLGRSRPAGPAAGAVSFIGAWAATFFIGRLTGSSAVLLLLVAGAVGATAATLAGWWRVRTIRAVAVSGPRRAEVGEPVDLHITLDDTAPRSASLAVVIWPTGRPGGSARGVVDGRRAGTTVIVTIDEPGTVEGFTGCIASLGVGGLVWWRRRITVTTDPIRVAPRSDGASLPVERVPVDARSDAASGPGTDRSDGGDVNGVRPWRAGESNQTIHWPSTVRTREVIARDRDRSVRHRRRVDLDQDPGSVRRTLDQHLRNGHEVEVSAPDLPGPVPVRDRDDAADWSVVAADRAHRRAARDDGGRRRRPFGVGDPERAAMRAARSESPSAHVSPRWWAALAAALSLHMLLGALGDAATTRWVATAGIVLGAALSVRFRNGVAPLRARMVVTLLALGALVRIGVQASGIDGLVEALRGPMPDLLVVLVVLHGAETVNQRTIRVHLAITGVVVAYATGLRLDGQVGWWLVGWGMATVAALTALTSSERPPADADEAGRTSDATRAGRPTLPLGRSVARGAAWFIAGTAAILAVASFVPVPDGPADLGLPALSNDDAVIDRPGALTGAAGRPVEDPDGDPDRDAPGANGGYRGFAETLDTSVRGGLGEEVVMRVRAPEPAFWRGQTFTDFDGRTWRVSDDDGFRAEGPRIDVPPTMGDLPFGEVPVEDFRQTFHVDVDLPNLVFAAARPSTLVFDGGVYLRPDGALRADRTLTAGSIYTVVSRRAQVTEEWLREQGDVADWFTPALGDPRLAPLLALPESTSDRTIELADSLRVDGSTYDTIRAYERWLAENTEYDLDAPVPPPGADAVDDFLFESRRGFCEQIASTLVVMLRSQGVPARLAAGYVSGERDRVSGVWKVRASDAHAWVEVWFPVTGWQAFDPTANVPLAGEATRSSVGGDVLAAIVDGARHHALPIAAIAAAAVVAGLAVRALVAARRRRRRGPWGRLDDRFVSLDATHDSGPRAHRRTNASIATSLVERLGSDPARGDPTDVARMLDRVGFDPTFEPGADDLEATEHAVAALEAAVRRAR